MESATLRCCSTGAAGGFGASTPSAPPGNGFGTARPGARTGPETFQWHAMHSDDDGVTWSEPADLTAQVKDPEWQAMFATSGTQMQTSTGRYLVPMVVRHADSVVSSRNAYSDDRGHAWKIGAAIGAGTDESHNVELAGGAILQNMRNGKTRAVARSTDGGIGLGHRNQNPPIWQPL